MRTITKILDYDLSSYEKEALLSCWIANGCGWKGGTNFDKILKDNIKYFPWYDPKKANRLLQDLKEICIEHDVDFRFKKGFYSSNYIFAKKIFKLLKKWVSFRRRFWLTLLVFILLCKYWRKFYS